jgi:hypothetical protein
LFTYLNQRYGLKGLIVENASQIIDAVKFYASADIEVMLFGKILKHCIDEQFWHILQKNKDSVHSLVTFYLRERYLRVSQIEFSNLVGDVLADSALVEKWVWSRVTDRMYDEGDCQRLNLLIDGKSDKKGKIKYSALRSIVMEF